MVKYNNSFDMESITITTAGTPNPKGWIPNKKDKPKLFLYYVRQRNYSIVRILFYTHIEKNHRLVFDNLYQQDYRIKLKDKPLLFYYKILFKIEPEFRCYLKYWKPILKRAYSQKRINWKNLIIWQKLQKVNTERYAPYAA